MAEYGRPSYSIIVVNYNGGSLIAKCIESVVRFTDDFELILVDNGSTDGSDLAIAASHPKIVILKNRSNIGFSRASNMGILHARGPWIILLNPDTTVTPDWLGNLSECMKSSPRHGIATPKLMRPDGTIMDEAGLNFDFSTGYTRGRGAGEVDNGQFNGRREIPSCSFACAMIRRDVFKEIGLLDEKMFLYYEDVDFCLRARIAGWKVIYCSESLVYHTRGGLTPRSSVFRRNAIAYRLRIMLKCYDFHNVLKYGAARIFRDVVAMAAGIKNNDLDYFLSYLRSPFWNIINLPIQERRTVQSKRRVYDSEIAALSGTESRADGARNLSEVLSD